MEDKSKCSKTPAKGQTEDMIGDCSSQTSSKEVLEVFDKLKSAHTSGNTEEYKDCLRQLNELLQKEVSETFLFNTKNDN